MIARALTHLRLQARPDRSIRRYVSDILRATVPALLVKLKSVLVIPVIVRVLGLGGYGIWVQIVLVTYLCSLIASLGLHTSLIRYYPEHKTKQEHSILIWTVFMIAAAGSLIMCSVLWLFSPTLAIWLFKSVEVVDLLRVGTCFVPLHSFNLLLLTIFRAQNNISRYVFFRTIFVLSDLVMTLITVLVFRSIHALLLGNIVSLLAINAILIIIHSREYNLLRLPAISIAHIRTYLKYSLPILPSQFSDEIAVRGDRMIIGTFLGPTAVGAYSVIYTLAGLPVFLNTPVVEVLLPKLSHLRNAPQQGTAARYMRGTLFIMALLSLSILALIILLRQRLWSLFAGQYANYVTDGLLASLLLIAGLGIIFYAVSRVLALRLFTSDQTLYVLLLYVIAGVVNTVLNIVLIPFFGLMGAVVATFVAYFCMVVVAWWLVHRREVT